MVRHAKRPLRARACRCGAPFMLGRAMDSGSFESWSHAPFLCLSASATIPGRHFAAGRAASFVEGGIGYREWTHRDGRIADIHSVDDRYDHDIDELIV
jgi:hypothetical protein